MDVLDKADINERTWPLGGGGRLAILNVAFVVELADQLQFLGAAILYRSWSAPAVTVIIIFVHGSSTRS